MTLLLDDVPACANASAAQRTRLPAKPALRQSPAWQALGTHFQDTGAMHLADLFAADPGRFERFSVQSGALFLDFSKNIVTQKTMELLFKLARQARVERARDAMFSGEEINHTEGRAVLHVALRNRSGEPMTCNGRAVMPAVKSVLKRMAVFSSAIRSGALRSISGERFSDIVNIGIGGSDLGPNMVVEALRAFAGDGPRVHFVSNVDDAHLGETLRALNPHQTLFIVASKTFTTQETMANATAARDWLLRTTGTPQVVARHFVALSSNLEATSAFGIPDERVFEFWDWVGGRFSLWGAIGLPIAIAVGMDNFESLLDGAHAMDRHFCSAPLEHNMPVIMALLGIWYANFHGCATHAVLPYDQYLHRLPAFLQQLDMESNGKRVDREGLLVDYATAPVAWGEAGTNGQHAFFQLLHQGTQTVPADFITAIHGHHKLGNQHRMLLANCLAQTQALAFGKSERQAYAELLEQEVPATVAGLLAPYKAFPGNRPSNTILLDRLTPHNLGALLALYEHKAFVQGAVWNINSFDQWGVELGKALAGRILDKFDRTGNLEDSDASTAGLLQRIRSSPTPT